jgi:hypothetical protein
MSDTPNIINMNDLEWQEEHYSEHYTGWSKRLCSPSMDRKQGHIGVRVERLRPKSLSCPFHYHVIIPIRISGCHDRSPKWANSRVQIIGQMNLTRLL